MKKHILLVIGIALFLNAAKAQSFHKGAIVIDLGAGLNISKTTIEEEYNSQVWTGSGLTTVRIQKDTNDAAASAVYPLVVEYGVKNWLGVAGRVAFSKYFTGNDSASGVKTDVRGIDAGLIFNLHLIKTKRFDMPIGVTLGYSNFKMVSNDALQNKAKDNGLNYGFAAVPRIYFGPGKHIGLSFNLGYMVYTYPNLLFSNKNDSDLNDNNDREFKLKASGANIGVGLIIKI